MEKTVIRLVLKYTSFTIVSVIRRENDRQRVSQAAQERACQSPVGVADRQPALSRESPPQRYSQSPNEANLCARECANK